MLWLHGQAVRRDLAPSQFGEDVPVDPSDARAVMREWRRQFRQWAAYSPEQVFALKVGAAALGALLAGWIALARAIG